MLAAVIPVAPACGSTASPCRSSAGSTPARSALRPAGIGAIDLGHPDRGRDRRRDQHGQLHRRRRRPRRRRLHDRGDRPSAVIALSLDRNAAGVLAMLTAGASLGFLRHGFPPASIFLGDSGSNLLGYMLAAVAVQGALKTNAVIALVFPLVILAVPILDSSFVIAKRLKYGRPVYLADSWHFHHRLARHRLLASGGRSPTSTAGRWSSRRWPWPCASSPTPTTTATSTPAGPSSWARAWSGRWRPASTWCWCSRS